jgi:NAD(P)-dependent dehydrogenase (short-subunit alcohol dehydrogenase family)
MAHDDLDERVNRSKAESLFAVAGLGAIVTGAASGLGLAMTRVLARNGARVTMIDVDPSALQAEADALIAEGGRVHTVRADVADANEIDAAVATAAEWDSGLHIAFANAGISAGPGPRFGSGLEEIDADRWDRVLAINLTGVMQTVRAAARHMTSGYGRIVITSSVSGVRADPMTGYAYGATKAGVLAITRDAALELAPRGIHVNAIAPGSFATNIGRSNPAQSDVLDALREAAALNRIADPSELEGLALLLASPASSYITGAVFSIDGGATIARNSV